MAARFGWMLGVVLSAAGCGEDGGGGGDAAAPGDAGEIRDAADVDAANDDGATSRMDAADGPTADCDAEPVPRFAEVEIFAKCLGCHARELEGDARNDAPADANFDDYPSAAAHAEVAALYVFHGVMPPPNAEIPVTEAEKAQLYLWALCGTPR